MGMCVLGEVEHEERLGCGPGTFWYLGAWRGRRVGISRGSVPGTALTPENVAVNTSGRNPCSHGVFLKQEADSKYGLIVYESMINGGN